MTIVDRSHEIDPKTLDAELETAPEEAAPKRRPYGAPDWATLPATMQVPDGAIVGFVRIPKEWTTAKKRDYQVIVWELTLADERGAKTRAKARGETEYGDELVKSAIRYIDGAKADWSGSNPDASPKDLWEAIGYKGRHALRVVFNRTHNFSDEDVLSFFARCVAFGTAG